MAIRWGDQIPKGYVIDDLISHIDFAPTLLDVAGLPQYKEIEGKSFLKLLLHPEPAKREPFREALFYGRERATSARPNNFGYPVRTIRTEQYQLVWNMKPDRLPAGDRFNESEAIVVRDEILKQKELNPSTRKMYDDAFGLRPEFELYDMEADPYGLENLAEDQAYKMIFDTLFKKLKAQLEENGDPRMNGRGDIWESYPRFMGIRNFEGDFPAHRAVYNEHFIQSGQRIPLYLLDSKYYSAYFEETGITKEAYIERLKSKGVIFY
jgi:N-sulfoglucosamine sulfohydrolase